MDNTYRDFMQSGKALITDTKTPKVKAKSVKGPDKGTDVIVSGDPHKVLIKRCIDEKIKKSDVIEEFMKFIIQAESEL
jgi:translation elongation factor EF-1alpha